MIIEIKGVQFINKGAELMLVAITQALESKLDIEFSYALSPRNSPYPLRKKYQAYQKIGNLFKRIDLSIFDFLIPTSICETYGLVKHKDIDVTLDASGFAYGAQWTPAMLKHSVRQARYMKRQGKKFIFMPQAMGPFDSKEYKKLIEEAVEYCTLMFIRDKQSYKYITDIVGKKNNVILSPDFTNIVNLPESETDGMNRKKIITYIPNNKMLSKQNTNSFGSYDYLSEFTDSAIYMQSLGYHVVILNHEGEKDLKLCKDIHSKLDKDNSTLLPHLDTLAIKKQIGRSDLVVCSRFHGCVSALSQGIPVIGTSWSHKYEMLFRDYNVENMIYKFDNSLSSFISSFEPDLKKHEKVIKSYVNIEKNKTLKMWDHIFNEII